jgi:hypothetical protein
MTAERKERVDEATLLDLLMKGDYAAFAKLTGCTVDQIERTLDGMDDYYDTPEEDEDRFFGELGDEEGEAEALA